MDTPTGVVSCQSLCESLENAEETRVKLVQRCSTWVSFCGKRDNQRLNNAWRSGEEVVSFSRRGCTDKSVNVCTGDQVVGQQVDVPNNA